MKINYLYIKEGLFSRKIKFSNHQLIFSKENSQGKTTLMRLILHSLGFTVPSTAGANFNNFVTIISLNVADEVITLERNGSFIEYKSKDKILKFNLPEEKLSLHTIVFNISEINLLENLLGAIYVDQTKGLVVLNRGEVIGNNTFTVEKFIAGLQNNNIDKLTRLITDERKKLKEYKSVLSIAQYKIDNNIYDNEIIDNINEEVTSYNSRITLLQSRIDSLKKSIKELKITLQENKMFLNIIESYHLYVSDSEGNKIPVNSNSIVGYNDNSELLNIQLKMLNVQLDTLKRELQEQIILEKDREYKELDVKEYKSLIDEKLKYVNLDYSKIKSIVNDCQRNIRTYNKQIKESITQKSDVVNFIQTNMIDCAKKLGVYKYIEKDGVFTNKIQKNSGAISYKIIISFRIAFILAVKEFKNIKLPLIIDSLRNGELDEENSNKILSVLNDKLKEHQIIVASIFEYNDFFDGIEVIKNRLIPLR